MIKAFILLLALTNLKNWDSQLDRAEPHVLYSIDRKTSEVIVSRMTKS